MSPESPSVPAGRVVVDTNVIISAALAPRGTPARLLDRILVSAVPVFSTATFAELESRLWMAKFDRYLSMEMRRGLLHDFAAAGHWIEIPSSLSATSWSRDRDDDHFIRAALASDAQWLISGDRDLLELGRVERILILSPGKALSR